MALIILCGNLSENKELEDAIPEGYLKTDVYHADLSLILIFLFILWNYLSSLFVAEGATLETYKKFCWKV